MFCDTHCHLFKEYYENIEEILQKAKDNKVNRYIVAGCDSKTNREVLNLLKVKEIYGCLGIHPEEVCRYTEEDLEFIEENLNQKKIIAIGEIGLDYHYDKETKQKQMELFERQLKLAELSQKPVVIHSREATNDTIEILKKYNVRGVIHSFSGSLEVANIYIKMGFLLGINGVITFKNSHLKEVIEKLDLSSIILETDSPYLTPTPFRGKPNDPSKVKTIAEYICNLKHISMEELANITNQNIKRLFDI